jgi:transglutaminase-like putative cysteine protease
MRYEVGHRTTYHYSQPVSISHHVLHLIPRACDRQDVLEATVAIRPSPNVRNDARDYFGNPVSFITIQEQHTQLVIDSSFSVDLRSPMDHSPSQTMPWDRVFDQLERDISAGGLATLQYAFDSPYARASADLAAYARESFPAGRPVLEAVLDLTRRIHRDFRYQSGTTSVSTPVEDVFRLRRGVCQDFAHLELSCLRSLALPARYVSGYLLTRPPPGKEKLVGSDASHAWVSVWCQQAGWVDVDPTNDTIARDEHITLAWGRDYGDISPVNGVIFGGGEHSIEVAVDVIRAASRSSERPPGA